VFNKKLQLLIVSPDFYTEHNMKWTNRHALGVCITIINKLEFDPKGVVQET